MLGLFSLLRQNPRPRRTRHCWPAQHAEQLFSCIRSGRAPSLRNGSMRPASQDGRPVASDGESGRAWPAAGCPAFNRLGGRGGWRHLLPASTRLWARPGQTSRRVHDGAKLREVARESGVRKGPARVGATGWCDGVVRPARIELATKPSEGPMISTSPRSQQQMQPVILCHAARPAGLPGCRCPG